MVGPSHGAAISRLSAFLTGSMPQRRAVALVWGVASAVFLAKTTSVFGVRDLDTDDAMRLVQVRDLMAGQGWFDLVQHRVDPPYGLVMHWSRLVDAPIAALIGTLRLALPADAAERVAMALWPSLLLLPALALVASIARSLGGRAAAPIALMLFCVVGPAGTQFFPGRIDHHNVQILACLAAWAGVLRLSDQRWAGLAAGLAGGVMLAVGVETLPYLVVLCAAAALMAARDPRRAGPGAALFGLGLAGATALLTVAAIPPSRCWRRIATRSPRPIWAPPSWEGSPSRRLRSPWGARPRAASGWRWLWRRAQWRWPRLRPSERTACAGRSPRSTRGSVPSG